VTSAHRDAPSARRTSVARSPGDVAAAAQLACLLEVSAPKPGNVSPGRHFADARYEDFLASAAAIGAPLAGAGARPLGATVRLAIESTARWTRSNTNLGIVLLLAPLARAALRSAVHGPTDSLRQGGAAVRPDEPALAALPDFPGDPPASLRQDSGGPPKLQRRRKLRTNAEGGLYERGLTTMGLRAAVRQVLADTDVDDARDVYAAIRIAAPGGLGKAEAQDIADEPTMTLVEVMRLSADRDGIAREYANAFEVTFERGTPALERARTDGLCWDDAVVETFLTLLAATPDTHIARRSGPSVAADVSRRAHRALQAGGVRSAAGRGAIDEMDLAVRDPRNMSNPGTTADLTAAAVFVALLGGEWHAHPVMSE
jgi:triphosphoribosyl-dephospho-CoA synthase